MSDTMSLLDFCSKIEWEGGVVQALEYGLKADDLDSDEFDPRAEQLRDIWVALQGAWETVARLEDEASEIIDRVLDESDDDE